MKKLIYILNQYSEKEGSHFYHVLRLLEEIALNNIQIVLIIEKASEEPNFEHSNIRVIVQKKKGIKRFFELLAILKKLNKEGYKIFFIRISQNGAVPAILVSKVYGGTVYYWQSGTTHILENKKFNLKNFIKFDLPFYFVRQYVDYFVTGPEEMLKYYEKEVGIKKEKLVCLYNDVDLNRFIPISLEQKYKVKKQLGIEENKKIILFVHRLSPVRKSLYYMPYILDKLLKNNDNYICYVIGGGSEQKELEKNIIELGLEKKIFVLGEKPNKDIQMFYQISDIFINPTYTEGFPRVIIEAMASGLPIVTTNAGGTNDLVGKLQKKYVVDIKNREEFSKKLIELINNENKMLLLGKENLKKVKRFSTENVAKMYIKEIFN